MDIAKFIQALPKAEVHLHLEGALPWKMVRAYTQEALPATPAWWRDEFRFDNFRHFISELALCGRSVLCTLDAYREAAAVIFQQLLAQNVRYVEISFAVSLAAQHNFKVENVAAVIREAVPPELTVCVIGGLSREYPDWITDERIEAILNVPALDGLDLHGDETQGGPAPFTEIFLRAQKIGWLTKAHAGELCGPQSIKDTLKLLQVRRIEHGTTAEQDPALLAQLAADNITLDMCPWSNVKLRVVDSIGSHPIRYFLQQGIRVTLSTDDPTIFGYSLSDELLSLVEHLYFTPSELAQLQINAFLVAKMPEAEKTIILNEIDALLDGMKIDEAES